MGITFGNNTERPSSWKKMSYEQLVKIRDEFMACDNFTECAMVVLQENFPDHVFTVARYGEWFEVDGNRITIWVWDYKVNREEAWNKISRFLAESEGAWE